MVRKGNDTDTISQAWTYNRCQLPFNDGKLYYPPFHEIYDIKRPGNIHTTQDDHILRKDPIIGTLELFICV